MVKQCQVEGTASMNRHRDFGEDETVLCGQPSREKQEGSTRREPGGPNGDLGFKQKTMPPKMALGGSVTVQPLQSLPAAEQKSRSWAALDRNPSTH